MTEYKQHKHTKEFIDNWVSAGFPDCTHDSVKKNYRFCSTCGKPLC